MDGGLTCHRRKLLSRLTPLVRIKTSSGGLPTREVIRCASMSSLVRVLETALEQLRGFRCKRYIQCIRILQGFLHRRFYSSRHLVCTSVWHAQIQYSPERNKVSLEQSFQVCATHRLFLAVISSAFFIAAWTEGGNSSFFPNTLRRTPY